MNENINLSEILKNCPKGWKFYSSVYGEVEFVEILSNITDYPVRFKLHGSTHGVSSAGEHFKGMGECTFFPSCEQRDWSKFSAPWYKKEKFDPNTLQPFDKVIACFTDQSIWCCGLFSCFIENANLIRCCGEAYYKYCIPYNDDTKHLVGTTEEAPEYYRYWED